MQDAITLVNTVRGTKFTLSQATGAQYLLESVDWGAISSNSVTYKYTNQVGVQVTNTTLETRDVEIIGWVANENPGVVDTLAKRLNGFINPLEPLKLQAKSYELTIYPTTSIKWGNEYKYNNDVMRRFKIDAFAADPLFRSIIDSKLQAGVVVPKFRFPLVIPKNKGVVFGVRQEYIILTVENKGDVPTGFRIEFLANKGTVDTPSLINARTQEFIKINKSMERGERIVISTEDGEKSIIGYANANDTEGSNYYKYKDLDSTWLKLALGDNLFKYEAEENVGNLAVTIYYNNKYLEVQ